MSAPVCTQKGAEQGGLLGTSPYRGPGDGVTRPCPWVQAGSLASLDPATQSSASW